MTDTPQYLLSFQRNKQLILALSSQLTSGFKLHPYEVKLDGPIIRVSRVQPFEGELSNLLRSLSDVLGGNGLVTPGTTIDQVFAKVAQYRKFTCTMRRPVLSELYDWELMCEKMSLELRRLHPEIMYHYRLPAYGPLYPTDFGRWMTFLHKCEDLSFDDLSKHEDTQCFLVSQLDDDGMPIFLVRDAKPEARTNVVVAKLVEIWTQRLAAWGLPMTVEAMPSRAVTRRRCPQDGLVEGMFRFKKT